jgi:hypothetical protein
MPRKKVKDMPRKQQMAVKASMAEQAAGKKSPAKFIRTGGSSITKNKLGKKINKVMEKGTKKLIDAGVHAYKNPKSMATGFRGLKKKSSPALAKLSASCKAAAKRKFKVYPSAYANMWASKTQRQGKC